ncbi:MAG: RMD1 family protein [Alphaproteobacteria bacterium]
MRCSWCCTAGSYHIDELAKCLRHEELEPKFYDDVIHISKTDDEGEVSDIFFFPYGCVVFWNCDEEEEESFFEKLKPYGREPLNNYKDSQDSSVFAVNDKTHIDETQDQISLGSNDVLIKFSLSHGLAQSAKLSVFESFIDDTIEKNRHLPKTLADIGKISLSRKKLAQKIGALFSERNYINLHSDILDTPEFFWRHSQYEPYYHMTFKYMDIPKRMDVLNKRLEVIHELYDILSNELKHAHSSRLEMVIIFLIVMEVFMHIFHDILRWF